MNNFVIFTDSACDINPSLLTEWGVNYINMTFRFDGEDKEYSNNDMNITDFYNKMRGGAVAKTAAINPDSFLVAFEEILKKGTDILYLAFSSGLSTTYNSAKIAAEELLEKYPERKIVIVDTLGASAGQGLIVYLAMKKKNEGADINEIADYINGIALNVSMWFTVDDLVYLKRGGRVSPTVALIGKALGIKPILHVDNDGKLISMSKARGRKAALSALADKYVELADKAANGPIFISHGDCLSEAEEVAAQIKAKTGAEVELISDIGAVIGAHSGPGTIALFFVGTQR